MVALCLYWLTSSTLARAQGRTHSIAVLLLRLLLLQSEIRRMTSESNAQIYLLHVLKLRLQKLSEVCFIFHELLFPLNGT